MVLNLGYYSVKKYLLMEVSCRKKGAMWVGEEISASDEDVFGGSMVAREPRAVKNGAEGLLKRIDQVLFEPYGGSMTSAERRQARLASHLLFFFFVAINSGVLYMWLARQEKGVGLVLLGMELVLFVAYLLTRTRRYRRGPFLAVLALALLPLFDGLFLKTQTTETFLVIFIWNIATILFSSVLVNLQATFFFACLNILILISFPLLVATVTLMDLAVPLIFNIVMSISILFITWHRNMLEKDRLNELATINSMLENELAIREKLEREMEHAATHDALTGLPNRLIFNDRLRHVLNRYKRYRGEQYAVLFLDLDGFKAINDTLGHKTGDLLLVEVSHRLRECLREDDTIARFGGDEFVILLENLTDLDEVISIVDRIIHEISTMFIIDGHSVHISTSIGIVVSKGGYDHTQDVIRDADIAMYRAKENGRNRYEIFDQRMLSSIFERLDREKQIREGFQRGEFIVYYQPIYALHSQQIKGFEALLRWQHQTKGFLAPSQFLDLAEETGIIVPLGYQVLEQACEQLSKWQSQYPSTSPLSVGVNLSTRQCLEVDLVKKIEEILARHKLEPSSLRIELAESVVVKDFKAIRPVLTTLQRKGIQVVIDDFGTGYSALRYLHGLSITSLKIDHAFISRMESGKKGKDIVRLMLTLARHLDMAVVAEGVETAAQMTALKKMACEYAQGYFFEKPVDAQTVEKLLQDQQQIKPVAFDK